MSYILDALKKSEEERHQGQVPNLGSNSSLIHNVHSKSVLWPWLIAALLVLNIAVVAYWMLSDKAKPEPEQSLASHLNNLPASTSLDDSPSEPRQSKNLSAETSSPIDDDFLAPSVKRAGLAYVEHANIATVEQRGAGIQGSSVVLRGGQYNANSLEQTNLSTEETEKKVIATISNTSELSRDKHYENSAENISLEQGSDNNLDISDEPLLITPKGKSRVYAGPSVINSAAEPHTNFTQESSEKREQASSFDLSKIKHISDKPHSFQRQIPDMAFNSHIYTDTPSSRRVMINNIYLREGQTFSGMKVDQITEEGIVLSLEGEAFKIGVLRDWYSPR